jgi:hypothetical protein
MTEKADQHLHRAKLRREHLVSFRLSHEEFESLMRVCNAEMATSVSVSVRSLLVRTLQKESGPTALSVLARLQRIEERLHEITSELRKLSNAVGEGGVRVPDKALTID